MWISCDGENPADVENLGAVHYYPRRGFPSYYFPYLNVDGYMPPLVAVQFENPKRELERTAMLMEHVLMSGVVLLTPPQAVC